MQDTDVNHGMVEVFAYQETLLMMAVFGVAILAMIWVGFRRWLQHKERLTQLIADQTAERTLRNGAELKRVEARLEAIEQLVTESAVSPPSSLSEPVVKAGDSQA
jgi:hypothetical protein